MLLFVHSLCDLTLMLAAYVIASWLIYSWYGYSRYARHRIQFSLPGISVTLSNSWHYCWEHCILCYCIDWLIDKCSELWMPCPWYACCIIVRFVWYLWYFGAKLEIFCHCINQFSPISFLACIDVPSILIFFVIKRNTALFHYFVINIVSRLPFSCAGECWAFVFLLIQVLL